MDQYLLVFVAAKCVFALLKFWSDACDNICRRKTSLSIQCHSIQLFKFAPQCAASVTTTLVVPSRPFRQTFQLFPAIICGVYATFSCFPPFLWQTVPTWSCFLLYDVPRPCQRSVSRHNMVHSRHCASCFFKLLPAPIVYAYVTHGWQLLKPLPLQKLLFVIIIGGKSTNYILKIGINKAKT